MAHNLPSFQIDITEELNNGGKTTFHHISVNTRRICSEVNLQIPVEGYSEETKKGELLVEENLGSYFTEMACRLSTLDNQQLMKLFGDIRVFYKAKRLQKHFAFKFSNQH